MWRSGESLGLGDILGNLQHTGNIYSQEMYQQKGLMMKKEQEQAERTSIKEDRASKKD